MLRNSFEIGLQSLAFPQLQDVHKHPDGQQDQNHGCEQKLTRHQGAAVRDRSAGTTAAIAFARAAQVICW